MAISLGYKCLTAAATVALLAGCSSVGTIPTTSHMTSNASSTGGVLRTASGTSSADAIGARVVYFSSFNGQPGLGQILVYPASLHAHNPNPIRTISDGTPRPYGMWVDSKGTLFVANIPQGNGGNYVDEYHPGAAAPFRTLTDQLYYPSEVAVSADGTVYVNERMGPSGLGDHVTIFPRGSTHASRIVDMNFTGYDVNANQMAFDRNGNLLVSASAFTHGGLTDHIFRLNTKTFKVTRLHLNLGSLDGPGLAVDSEGNIYVSGAYTGQIDVFSPGSENPSRVIPQGAQDMTIMRDGTLYASTGSGINEYMPGASSPVNTINAFGQLGFGIAVGPAN